MKKIPKKKIESFLHSGDFEKWKTQEKVESFFSDSNKQLRNVIRDKSKAMYYCRWPNQWVGVWKKDSRKFVILKHQ